MQKDGIKDRKYQGVLYPDSESYCCDDVLNILKSTFPEFAYILHDKDVDENGELKKPHIHWVGRLKAARYLAALADDLGIAENMIERCRSFDAFIRYLIHADDPDKFHYPLEAVISTFPINKFFRDDEEIQAGRLADYIIDARCSSMSNAVRWALKNGCWGTLRRAGSIWSAVISENRVLNMCESDQRHLIPGGVRRSVFYDPIEQKADFEPERMMGENLDADKKVTSCQQYQSGTWTECQGSVCKDGNWVELTGYSFAGQVVNEDDFAEVIDKKEDPAAGTDANPEAEATSFTVHYYKEGTTDKVRRDTVYQNLAVGAAFTASAPTVKGYKALAASAEITVTADGEHIFYYSVDESTDPGGSDDDPSKPGFFDGLLSGVKSLVNVLCGFLGGVVQSVLSGITGIISTLIDAFKAVLSLGGHFGDFLAAALGFVPREIIDLLIAGIAVSIALAIIKFIRG